MHGKEFTADCIRTFFTVVTLINIAMFLMGICLMPESKFGYEGFIVPVIYGLVGTLPNFALYSKRELKPGELLVRKIIQLILTEAGVLAVAFYGTPETESVNRLKLIMALSILIIFALATVFDWLQNYLTAKQLTEDLLSFQEKARE